jgi:hypothetical protein
MIFSAMITQFLFMIFNQSDLVFVDDFQCRNDLIFIDDIQ